ncbi:hypothetical protein ODJ79_30895 [Actinoplanes sp. KI2]|uniref:hypothetical protein n=1 Tax=Actinoplanes sp. KI2 TaxID=2983315 RepID=UPI0021D58EC3|nr:hypothetical protein [Actinoplanes sp. KI2]MCU7728147.1 hypothetical protein [Actinoplanes sp. KI2]
MRQFPVAVAATILLISLGACGGGPATPSVPRLATGGGANASAGAREPKDDNPNAVAGDASAARRARLHAAAQCIRQHGAPNYQDPVLTADGYVYTDEVAMRSLSGEQLTALTNACQDLIHAANFAIRDQGPPPPALIQAGVRAAQCLRANGLTAMKDPTAQSRFSPGKGFGLSPDEVPPGGKENPIFRRAVEACRPILDAEASASSLGNLGHA